MLLMKTRVITREDPITKEELKQINLMFELGQQTLLNSYLLDTSGAVQLIKLLYNSLLESGIDASNLFFTDEEATIDLEKCSRCDKTNVFERVIPIIKQQCTEKQICFDCYTKEKQVSSKESHIPFGGSKII